MTTKKKRTILRLSEISLADILHHLLKNLWVALLIALAAALTTWTVIGLTYPETYSGNLNIAVRNTLVRNNWKEQFNATQKSIVKLNSMINDGSLNTNYATEELNRKVNVSVSSALSGSENQKTAATNFLTITATGESQVEVYLYLVALERNLDQIAVDSGVANIALQALTVPTMPTTEPSYSAANQTALVVAAAVFVLSCLLVVWMRLRECRLATRKAVERLCVLPLAGALNKGGRGKGIDALLPLPMSEQADGLYVRNLSDAASFLLAQKAVRLQILPLDPKNESSEEVDRIALDLALAMSAGNARVCLVDRNGSALSALSIEEKADKTFYSVKGSRLTVTTASPEQAEAEGFDKVICASDLLSEGRSLHTLWVFRTGCYTADEINGVTAPGGGTPASASLLAYGMVCASDAAAAGSVPAKINELDYEDEEEADLLRLAAAILKAIGRIRKKWLIAFAVVTVAALAVGFLLRYSTYRVTTEFTIATFDVTESLTDDQLAGMSVEDAIELMDQGAEPYVYGDALYPSSLVANHDLLMTTMPIVWSRMLTVNAIEDYMDEPFPADSLYTWKLSNGDSFTLSVIGSDKEKLAEVTDAFFAVAPDLSDNTAGGLTFFRNESSTSANGPSVVLVLLIAWVLVIGAGIAYALLVSLRDRTALLRYETEDALSTRVIDKLSIAGGGKTGASDKDVTSADIGLARFIYEWAEKETNGALLMITSAMREEGSAELTRTVEALLKQNGKRAAIADRATCEKLLTEGREALAELLQTHDFILIDRPGMAVDSDAQLLAAHADALLWANRVGYADKERLEAAASVCPNEKVLGCVRMIG